MRLRHEAGHADGYRHAPLAGYFLVFLRHLLRQSGNPHNILISFCRQSHHEVQLDLLPALLEGSFHRSHEIFLCNALVDNITEPLGTCLRCKGQAAFPDLLHLMCQINGKAVYAQGWQGKAHLFILEIRKQVIYQLPKAGIICRTQGGQGHLVVAGRIHQLPCQLPEPLAAALTDRTVGSTCLTEAAPPGAAPEKLQHNTVMDNINIWQYRLFHKRHCIHVLNQPLINHLPCLRLRGLNGSKEPLLIVLCMVEGRHINAIQPCGTLQKALSSPGTSLLLPLAKQACHLADDFLSFTQDKEVKEISYRLRVVHARTAAYDKRLLLAPVTAPDGDTCQIQHIQDIGINHLILQGKAQKVKILYGMKALQGKQGNLPLTHNGFHIHPGCIHTLTGGILPAVQHLIKDFQPQVGHAHLIDIRQCQGKMAGHAVPVLMHGIQLMSRIAGRLLHRLQNLRFQIYNQSSYLFL